jgi:hypothetical protein
MGFRTLAATRSHALARRRRLRKGRVTFVAIAGLILISFVTMHAASAIHEGGRRAVAERLTRAIIERDEDGIRDIFVAGVGDTVVKDIRLGALADRMKALGDLREVRVQHAGHDREAWVLLAVFQHGTQRERVQFAGDHVAAFIASPSEVATDVMADASS